jgi:hypothetical protein
MPTQRTLRDYAFVKCVAFPQVTQTVAYCMLGMHRIAQMRMFGAVAADPKRATFQQLQGDITTKLKMLLQS